VVQSRHGSVCVQRSTDIELWQFYWVTILAVPCNFVPPAAKWDRPQRDVSDCSNVGNPYFVLLCTDTLYSVVRICHNIYLWGTAMAVRRNLFPWIRLHKGAMNSIKLATPICLISCIQTVAVLRFFQTLPSNFLYLHYSKGSRQSAEEGFWSKQQELKNAEENAERCTS